MTEIAHRALPVFGPARPTIVLVGDELARHVTSAPREVTSVRLVRRLGDFEMAFGGIEAGACVIPADGALGLRAQVLLERIRRAAPAVRIVVLVPRHVSTSHNVPALMRAGAHDMILDGTDVFWERVGDCA